MLREDLIKQTVILYDKDKQQGRDLTTDHNDAIILYIIKPTIVHFLSNDLYIISYTAVYQSVRNRLFCIKG